MNKRWLLIGAGIVVADLAGVLLIGHGFLGSCQPAGGPITTQPTKIVLKDRPVPGPVQWKTRILTHGVQGMHTVTEGTPDTARVRAFARAVFTAESLRAIIARGGAADTTKIPKGLPPVAGRYNGRELTLWLSRADGSVFRSTARLKPRWEFQASQGDVLDSVPRYREDRWFVRAARETVGCLPRASLIGTAGAFVDRKHRLRDGLITGAAALIGCLAD